MDQSDAVTANSMAALKLNTGLIFKVATLLAWSIGDLVRANVGVLAAVTPGTDAIGAGVFAAKAEQSFGVVLEYSAASGYVVVAS
jgi:hypothetical protein